MSDGREAVLESEDIAYTASPRYSMFRQPNAIDNSQMRNGKVAATNPARGMIAIATEDDGYTIIELLSEWELEKGDLVRWANDHGLGSEIYENLTKRSRAEVYVQNHGVSQSGVRGQLLL